MEIDVNKNEWQVYGRCYDENNPDCEGSITLPEQITNLSMGDAPKPSRRTTADGGNGDIFGVPIDANLAVHLIKNSYSLVDQIFEKTNFIEHLQINNEKFSAEDIQKAKETVLNLMYGITFDKAIVLKVLGQPNCEGLRSYVCAREGGHLSLVLVGVDANGFDLYFDPVIVGERAGNNVPPNSSLTVEYGYPPGAGIVNVVNRSKRGEIEFDQHYVLLNYINLI